MPDPIINQGTDNQTTQTTDFISMLSPEMQSHPAAAKFKGKSADEFFESYSNLESLIGKKTIEKEVIPEGLVKLPGENATKEELREFHKLRGVPETPDTYELPDFTDMKDRLPPGFTPDQKIDTWFRQKALDHALTPGQFKGLYKEFIDFQLQSIKEDVASLEDQTKQAYGNNYDKAIKDAQRAAGRLSQKTQQMVGRVIGKDPITTRILAEIGANLGESQSPDGAGAPMGGGQELNELNSRYEKLINSPEYQSGKKPSMVKEAEELLSRILFLKGKIGIKK